MNDISFLFFSSILHWHYLKIYLQTEFASVCASSTDFHFPSLQTQLEVIEQQVAKGAEIKLARRAETEGDNGSVCSAGSGEVSV